MTFNTPAYARRLKAGGFTDAQAEALAEVNREMMIAQAISTKPVPRLERTELAVTISELRANMSAAIKQFGLEFRAVLKEFEMRLTLRMMAVNVAVVVAVAAIIKL